MKNNQPPNKDEFDKLTNDERKAKMEERKTEMDAKRKALEQWAKDNEIDSKYLMFLNDGGHHGRPEGAMKSPDETEKTQE